jgi:RHS repeat-associated protein
MRSRGESGESDVHLYGANGAFPEYDTGSNAKALLPRTCFSFSTTAWRHYDVWGSLQTGSALDGASQRCYANLGHVTDDESGLVYIRARLYEPWTARFISEDPAADGANWLAYCCKSPENFIDDSGRSSVGAFIIWNAHILITVELFAKTLIEAFFGRPYFLHAFCTATQVELIGLPSWGYSGIFEKTLGQMISFAKAGIDASLKCGKGVVAFWYAVLPTATGAGLITSLVEGCDSNDVKTSLRL